MQVSPCQSAHTSTLCFLRVPDRFSKWPRGPFSLKEELAVSQWEQLIALATGKESGTEQPIPTHKIQESKAAFITLSVTDTR